MEYPDQDLTSHLRNDNAAPKKTASASRRWAAMVPMLLFVAISRAIAAPEATRTSSATALLLGQWLGADRASQARYGRILVGRQSIQWSGSAYNPGCRVRYSLSAEKSTGTYPHALPDASPNEVSASGRTANPPASLPTSPTNPTPEATPATYSVFRLSLAQRKCSGQRSAIQFAIAENAPDRAEIVTYDRQNQAVSWGHFTRSTNPGAEQIR